MSNKLAQMGNNMDERYSAAGVLRTQLNKVFPTHWSFMLGEMALYSFIILLLTGTYLALFFDPSITKVIYDGTYAPLNGVEMSRPLCPPDAPLGSTAVHDVDGCAHATHLLHRCFPPPARSQLDYWLHPYPAGHDRGLPRLLPAG